MDQTLAWPSPPSPPLSPPIPPHWIGQEQKLLGSDTDGEDAFGHSVSIDEDGELLVVGAPYAEDLGVDEVAGQPSRHHRREAPAGTQRQRLEDNSLPEVKPYEPIPRRALGAAGMEWPTAPFSPFPATRTARHERTSVVTTPNRV